MGRNNCLLCRAYLLIATWVGSAHFRSPGGNVAVEGGVSVGDAAALHQHCYYQHNHYRQEADCKPVQ